MLRFIYPLDAMRSALLLAAAAGAAAPSAPPAPHVLSAAELRLGPTCAASRLCSAAAAAVGPVLALRTTGWRTSQDC